MSEKMALFAFDGMDKQIIEDLDLKNIKQEEFSSYDNSTEISRIITDELFTSLITGKTSEEHNIDAGRKFENRFIDFFEKKAQSYRAMRKFKGLRMSLYGLLPGIDGSKREYSKKDINALTLFDKLKNSRAMFIPVFNDRYFWDCGIQMSPLQNGFGVQETFDFYIDHNFNVKKNKVISELQNEIVSPRDFVMAHFHRPDFDHHLYYDPELGREDREKLERNYRKLDELAGELRKEALESGYDKVIFLSDHGLPTLNAHNKNAFYSCNQELFGDKTPHITDFHDKILELVNENGGRELEGADL